MSETQRWEGEREVFIFARVLQSFSLPPSRQGSAQPCRRQAAARTTDVLCSGCKTQLLHGNHDATDMATAAATHHSDGQRQPSSTGASMTLLSLSPAWSSRAPPLKANWLRRSWTGCGTRWASQQLHSSRCAIQSWCWGGPCRSSCPAAHHCIQPNPHSPVTASDAYVSVCLHLNCMIQ